MYSLFFIRQAFLKKNYFSFFPGKSRTVTLMNVALPTPFRHLRDSFVSGVQIYHPFLNPQGFFKTFFAFFLGTPTTSCQQAYCMPTKPRKRENNLTLFPITAKQRHVKIATDRAGPACRKAGGEAASPKQGKGYSRTHDPTLGENTKQLSYYMYKHKIVPIYIANINTRCYLCTLITTKKHDQNNFTRREH